MSTSLYEQEQITPAILACLTYFDIFKHPLSQKEIHIFLKIKVTSQQLEEGIHQLIGQQQIHDLQGYYSLHPQPQLVENRKAYEARANQFFPLAIKNGNLIRKFPFIKGVFISGSLSKYVMKRDADIDYFIITTSNRIWLSKLFLLIYKLFLSKENRELLCINYFISEDELLIKEQNTFTATELRTLIPLGCSELHKKMLETNDWTNEFLPNKRYIPKPSFFVSPDSKKTIFTKIVEGVFSGIFGKWANYSARQFHQIRNEWKYSSLKNHKDYKLMLRSTANEIKVHDKNHQMTTLDAYEKGCENLNLIK